MSTPSAALEMFRNAQAAIQRGDHGAARALLARAAEADPKNPEIPMFLGLSHRLTGDWTNALAAFDRALSIDPYFFMALLSKGAVFEAMGQMRLAASTYRGAIKIAPHEDRLPPQARAALSRARTVVEGEAKKLAAFLRDRVAKERATVSGERMDRFEASVDILAGVTRHYVQEPLFFAYPQLPAIPFFDRNLFPWLPQLEARTADIRAELETLIAQDWDSFKAYIQYPAHAPVNQWNELNHNRNWSTLHLWRDGRRDDAVCARAPVTAGILSSTPMADQPGYAPTAMFSVMQPKTHIPAHTGSTNVRAILHLPLIVPPKCRFRVANVTREWVVGEAFVFDDTIEHEAWNDSDQIRAVLIIDVWNPLLSQAERNMISALGSALHEYELKN